MDKFSKFLIALIAVLILSLTAACIVAGNENWNNNFEQYVPATTPSPTPTITPKPTPNIYESYQRQIDELEEEYRLLNKSYNDMMREINREVMSQVYESVEKSVEILDRQLKENGYNITDYSVEKNTKECFVTSTGSCYHNHNCGNINMNKVKYMSINDAKEIGYKACSKCY